MARFFSFLIFSSFVSFSVAQFNLPVVNVTENLRTLSVEAVTEVLKNISGNVKNFTKTVFGKIDNVNETSSNSTVDNTTISEIPIKNSTVLLLAAYAAHSKVLGEKCGNETDCKTEGASCISQVCRCKDGYVLSNSENNCLPIARTFEDKCSENQQCDGLKQQFGVTACILFKCSCAPDYKLVNGRCIANKVLGIICTKDEECQTANTVCRQGICVCVNGTLPNPDDNMCLPVATRLNDSCSEPSQCDYLGQAQCREGRCVCKPLTHLLNNKCVNRKALGDDCDDKAECEVAEEPGKRSCVEHKCSCIVGRQDEDICTGSATSLTVGLAIALVATGLFV